jgi:hypothetical protein
MVAYALIQTAQPDFLKIISRQGLKIVKKMVILYFKSIFFTQDQ